MLPPELVPVLARKLPPRAVVELAYSSACALEALRPCVERHVHAQLHAAFRRALEEVRSNALRRSPASMQAFEWASLDDRAWCKTVGPATLQVRFCRDTGGVHYMALEFRAPSPLQAYSLTAYFLKFGWDRAKLSGWCVTSREGVAVTRGERATSEHLPRQCELLARRASEFPDADWLARATVQAFAEALHAAFPRDA